MTYITEFMYRTSRLGPSWEEEGPRGVGKMQLAHPEMHCLVQGMAQNAKMAQICKDLPPILLVFLLWLHDSFSLCHAKAAGVPGHRFACCCWMEPIHPTGQETAQLCLREPSR